MTNDKSPRERLLMDPEWRFHLGDYVPAALDNEQMISMETAPRERKPLSEFVFSGWGESAILG